MRPPDRQLGTPGGPAAVLIALSQPIWPAFWGATEILGLTLLDNNRIPPIGLAPFLIALADVLGRVEQPNIVLRRDLEILNHSSATFLVHASLVEFLALTTLGIRISSASIEIAIASATLAEWKQALTCGMLARSSLKLRNILLSILLDFRRAGLGEVFEDYELKSFDSGGYILCLR